MILNYNTIIKVQYHGTRGEFSQIRGQLNL